MRPTLGTVLRTLGQATAVTKRRLPMTVAIGQQNVQLTSRRPTIRLRVGG
jgi:hypothetical protein